MKRLLIADDDAGMRAALEARFERRGWLVDVAVNGTEALEKFRSGLHSLVITDVRMPGRDGFELMREVQNSAPGTGARTAVILLTAYACVPDAVEAMRNGACDYGKIGEWIEKLGFASEREVTKALALQWGCPVALSFDPATSHFPSEIPLPILETFQMIPLNYAASTKTLYIAFGERVDHSALCAIEKILDCRTLPCVAGRESVARQIDAMRQLSRPSDVEFGPISDLSEMARIVSSYTARLSPRQVRLSRVGRFIWLRFEVKDKIAQGAQGNATNSTQSNLQNERRSNVEAQSHSIATNLIFRLPNESPRPLLTRAFRDLYPVTPSQVK
jgi:CheY-like chemotaxis protein